MWTTVERRWTLRRVLCILPKFHELYPQRLQIGPAFLPTLRKFCILLHCEPTHTDVTQWNSTKVSQKLRSAFANACPKSHIPPKLGAQKQLSFWYSFATQPNFATDLRWDASQICKCTSRI